MSEGGSSATSAAGWPRMEAALDELLSLPADRRAAAIDRIAGSDAVFAAELHALGDGLDDADALFDRPAAHLLHDAGGEAPGLPAGTRLGPWRIVALLGRGGMGEVYRAERADGQFEQQVAIKMLRLDAAATAARFRAERQIVARLDHPGIARLIDGDVSEDGRPYMAMELVVGRHLIEWCAANSPTLEQRLDLFADICAAVAYAHRNLVVHRDLKPANVLVTAEGRARLLDFGIARLLDAPSGEATQELLLTPAYAAPEQLSGGPITTAADVHALGLLLHELLCGRPAYPVQHLPLAAAMQHVITRSAPLPSRVARELDPPPVPASRLEGDLDAIVAKALRKEPEQRYASVDDMRADVERYRRHLPVLARRGNWSYVAARALRRHRPWAFGAGFALLLLIGGTSAIAWQARVAREEAARATAVKNFLLQVFRASDPRVASDQPRGQATVRALLDVSADRIEHEFASQPALQIELLGTVLDLYHELGETERFRAFQERRLALAHRYPGRFPQVDIEAFVTAAADDLAVPDLAKAEARLTEADRLISQAGLDESALRARWWLTKGQAEESSRLVARRLAYDKALALYGRYAPRDPGRVTAMADRALSYFQEGNNEAAVRGNLEALAADESTDNRDDGEMQTIWGNLAHVYVNMGRYDDAAKAYDKAADIAHRTYGEKHSGYWVPAAASARLLDLNGERDEAFHRLEALRALMPYPPLDTDGWEALTSCVRVFTAQGRAALALPLQEAAEAFSRTHANTESALRVLRLTLGDLYEQSGRDAEARRMLQLAYDDYVASEPLGQQTLMAATERWARFLVAHGDVAAAHRLFDAVLAQDHDRHLAHAALAEAGLARVALAEGRAADARGAIDDAQQRWKEVRGFRDVRMGVYITRVRAAVLLAAGDRAGAREAAAAALAASDRYDAPEARTIAEARALLKQAS